MRGIDLLGRASELPTRVAPGTTVLAAEGITLEYDTARVLDDVSLTITAGEVLALVGPNGAGKSSLLAVTSGDLKPTRGRVLLHDRPLSGWSHVDLSVRRAVMLQQTNVAFSFTVRDVVAMGRAPWARTAAEDDDMTIIDRAIAAADVAHLADRSVPTLSGGELARVAFARVLAQQTDIMLLDEPTASLDLHHQELVMGLVRERAAAGVAAVVVVHDLDLAAAYADRVAVLAGGRLVALGPPAEVLTSELVSDVYGHPVEVLAHPRTGALLILPRRG